MADVDYKKLLLDIVAAMDEDDGHSDFSMIQEPLEKALNVAYDAVNPKVHVHSHARYVLGICSCQTGKGRNRNG